MLIWANIFNVKPETIDRNSSFFSAGGNSLKAVVLISKINSSFGVEITVKDIFTLIYLRKLCDFIAVLIKARDEILSKTLENMSTAEKQFYLGNL
jgi:acyl carrier protein